MKVLAFCNVEGCTWTVASPVVQTADTAAEALTDHVQAHLDDRPLILVVSVTVDQHPEPVPESAEPPEEPVEPVEPWVDPWRRRKRT